TCTAKLHNLSKKTTAAVLQVFKINTLAACWMLRDIAEHKPEQRFATYRKRNSTRYLTDRITQKIQAEYRERIRSRYTLNSCLFGGLCVSIGNLVSGYLQKSTEARQKGLYQKYQECANFVVKFGRNRGQRLGSLGRRTIFGYAFIKPKREHCEQVLRCL